VRAIGLTLCGFVLTCTSLAHADIAGIVPTKLVLLDRIAASGKAKAIFVAQDVGVHKGAGVDAGAIATRLEVSWGGTRGTFVMPAGAHDGTRGWKANTAGVAKYVNGAAGPTPGDTVGVSVVKPGRVLKVVAKGLGDGPSLDLFEVPSGDIAACYTVTNGTEVHRFGARWPAASCTYREIAGGTGRKLVCTGGGVADPSCGPTCTPELAPNAVAPNVLSDTGLFDDIATKTVAPYAHSYAPLHQLWADGASKNRWIYLPPCAQIDTTDMDVWSFPVGTRLWKQFDEGGELLETRMIHRWGTGPDDFLFAVYQWNAGSTEATLVTGGAEDVKGTEHDIPSNSDCQFCHGDQSGGGGLPSRYLGFSAIQLSHAGPGVTMASLSADGLLTNPAPGGFTIPGTATERAALGYLHANCANCHNTTPDGVGFLGMEMRVRTTDATVGATGVYTTVVNQPVTSFVGQGCDYRVAGGDTGDSCVHFRMSERGTDMTPNGNQMPPLASDVVDASGLAAIAAWITGLPPPPP
jgi:hypothetical protein